MSELLNGNQVYITEVNGTKTKFIRKDGLTAAVVAFMETSEAASNTFASYHMVKLNNVGGTDGTGFANDTTAYTATVTVDGVDQAVSVTGSDAQTYSSLVTEINADLTGVTASLSGGNIVITHDTAGESNQLSITDGTLFSSLTDFVGMGSPVSGGLAGILQTSDLPTTGNNAWEIMKGAVEVYDSNSPDILIAGSDLSAPSATYTQTEIVAMVDMINALKAKIVEII